uniref:Mitochondrial basic amino acids transporter n=1 Tax=Timema poppense TaxID=170557 RepID=A0A7R9CQX3_TIMPO|nr:unnamed protein product [Timema poppensis]
MALDEYAVSRDEFLDTGFYNRLAVFPILQEENFLLFLIPPPLSPTREVPYAYPEGRTTQVCLQTQDFRNPQYRGTIHCVSSLLKKEGMKGLYKGMSSPMSGVALVNAIVFGVNGNVQRRMSDPDSMKSLCLAGASAGFVQSFVCSPMELVKTRIQIQQNNRSSYKNPLDCLVKVARTEGYRHGVFKGLGVTILRDVPAVSSYFLAYELMTRSYAAPISTLHMLIAGGLAGTFSWVVTYPVDVIKSRLQADGVGKYGGLVDCFRKSVRSEGFSFLTRGLTSTVLRAFPTNAATFTVVTWVFRWCNNHPTVAIDNSVYCVPMSYEDYVINVTMRKDHSPDNILGVKVFSFKEKKDGYLRSVILWRKALLHGLVGDFNHHLQPMKERPANKVGRVDLDEMESKVMALFFKNVGQIHFESRNVSQVSSEEKPYSVVPSLDENKPNTDAVEDKCDLITSSQTIGDHKIANSNKEINEGVSKNQIRVKADNFYALVPKKELLVGPKLSEEGLEKNST